MDIAGENVNRRSIAVTEPVSSQDPPLCGDRLRSIRRFAFLTLDEFTTIAFSSAIEVLRMANRLSGHQCYSWSIITVHGEPVASSNGLVPRQAANYENSGDPEVVFVCGGSNISKQVDQHVIALLRRMARDSIILGGLCTGTYALVKAGLLDGYQCTIHWENIASLREIYPRVHFREELFVIDRDRITCAGGIAPIDMMLALVRAHYGNALVAEISDQLVLDRVRDTRDLQRIPLAARFVSTHRALANVAALMEANVEEPLSAGTLAQSTGLSLRQLQRMFRESLGMTPTEYYMRLRLRRGRELLLQSQMSITQIAALCGFHSMSHFSKAYCALFGCTPRKERQKS